MQPTLVSNKIHHSDSLVKKNETGSRPPPSVIREENPLYRCKARRKHTIISLLISLNDSTISNQVVLLTAADQYQRQSEGVAVVKLRVKTLREAVVRNIVELYHKDTVQDEFPCALVYDLFGKIGTTQQTIEKVLQRTRLDLYLGGYLWYLHGFLYVYLHLGNQVIGYR